MKFLNVIILMLLFALPSFAQNTVSVDEMIGQMIITGFHGTKNSDKGVRTTINQLEKGQIGGVIIYEFNVENPPQLLNLTRDIYKSKAKFMPFISIDQEGGIVAILNRKNGFKDFLSAENISEDTLGDAYEMYFDLAYMLRDYYFNLNYAPCVDLLINKESIIAKKQRSYGINADKVTQYASEAIQAHNDNNIATSLKHFPGHGNIKADTHLGFADATSTWNKNEIIPYQKLMNNEKTMIMISHIYNKNIDKQFPASLSKNTIDNLLRKKLGYNGVVITDDLQMGAISNNYTLEEIVINSINAGNDILLFSNYNTPDYKIPLKVRKIIKNGIKDGTVDINRIIESYNRITIFKLKLKDGELKRNANYQYIEEKYKNKKPTYWGENAPYVKTKIRTDEKILAITLDLCGSKTDNLDENLISFLIKEKIPATFFVTSKWIKKYPEKFERLSKEPLFEIENHGMEHKPASTTGKSIYRIEGTKNVRELINEVDGQGKNIEQLTGKRPLFYRSGTAYYDENATKIIEELGYQTIGFAVLGDAGATYSAKKVEKAALKARSGDILIFHANHPEKETGIGLINALPKLKAKGFKFVKLEDYKNDLY